MGSWLVWFGVACLAGSWLIGRSIKRSDRRECERIRAMIDEQG